MVDDPLHVVNWFIHHYVCHLSDYLTIPPNVNTKITNFIILIIFSYHPVPNRIKTRSQCSEWKVVIHWLWGCSPPAAIDAALRTVAKWRTRSFSSINFPCSSNLKRPSSSPTNQVRVANRLPLLLGPSSSTRQGSE